MQKAQLIKQAHSLSPEKPISVNNSAHCVACACVHGRCLCERVRASECVGVCGVHAQVLVYTRAEMSVRELATKLSPLIFGVRLGFRSCDANSGKVLTCARACH